MKTWYAGLESANNENVYFFDILTYLYIYKTLPRGIY